MNIVPNSMQQDFFILSMGILLSKELDLDLSMPEIYYLGFQTLYMMYFIYYS